MVMRKIRCVFTGLPLTTTLLAVSTVQGQTPTTLDQRCQLGRAAMRKGDLVTGCPLLQDSYDDEPNDVCLAALARCRDFEGKRATALEHYREYLGAFEKMSEDDQTRHTERAQFARKRVSELEAVVPTLQLVWRGEVPKDIQVKFDGSDALGQLNTDWPFDPGERRIEVLQKGVADEPRAVTLDAVKPVVSAPRRRVRTWRKTAWKPTLIAVVQPVRSARIPELST